MEKKWKAALTLMDIVWEDRKANYEKVSVFAEKAYAAGADLLLLPEMSFTGFSMNTEKTAETFPYESVERMKALSEKFPHMAIGFGFAGYKETGTKAFNCMEVVQDGKSLMHYEKIHPFTYGEEGRHFNAGAEITLCEVNGMKVGGFICYDLRFPEIFQISSETAEFIFVLANWPRERAMHWKLLLQARAVENQCFIAGVNRIGEGGGLIYEPGSMAFDPLGNPLAGEFYGTYGEEGFLLIEADPGQVCCLRKDFPLKADRREDLYQKYYKKSVK